MRASVLFEQKTLYRANSTWRWCCDGKMRRQPHSRKKEGVIWNLQKSRVSRHRVLHYAIIMWWNKAHWIGDPCNAILFFIRGKFSRGRHSYQPALSLQYFWVRIPQRSKGNIFSAVHVRQSLNISHSAVPRMEPISTIFYIFNQWKEGGRRW